MDLSEFFKWLKGIILGNSQVEEPKPQPEPQPEEYTVKTYKATGMEHRLDNLLRLGIENPSYSWTKKELIEEGLTEERIWETEFYPSKVELVPEPDNPYDPNAIKVVVDGEHVAYIKQGSCKHLLKVIKEDRIKKIECEIGGGRYKYIAEDYNDYGKEVYTLDRDTVPYFVHLQITEKR